MYEQEALCFNDALLATCYWGQIIWGQLESKPADGFYLFDSNATQMQPRTAFFVFFKRFCLQIII